jgi:hypothetical protein
METVRTIGIKAGSWTGSPRDLVDAKHTPYVWEIKPSVPIENGSVQIDLYLDSVQFASEVFEVGLTKRSPLIKRRSQTSPRNVVLQRSRRISGDYGTVFLHYRRKKNKIEAIAIQLILSDSAALTKAFDHRISLFVYDAGDRGNGMYMGRPQEISTNLAKNTRVYTWNSLLSLTPEERTDKDFMRKQRSSWEEHERDSILLSKPSDKTSRSLKSLVTTRAQMTKTTKAYDGDEYTNSYTQMPMDIDGVSELIFEFYNKREHITYTRTSVQRKEYKDARSCVAAFVVNGESFVLSLFFDKDQTSLVSVNLVVTNFTKALDFKDKFQIINSN